MESCARQCNWTTHGPQIELVRQDIPEVAARKLDKWGNPEAGENTGPNQYYSIDIKDNPITDTSIRLKLLGNFHRMIPEETPQNVW